MGKAAARECAAACALDGTDAAGAVAEIEVIRAQGETAQIERARLARSIDAESAEAVFLTGTGMPTLPVMMPDIDRCFSPF